MTFDPAGNVYVTDAHQGIIWKVGPGGAKGRHGSRSPLLKPTRIPPTIGANGLAFNNKKTALFVANTANDIIVKIPVSGAALEPGTPEVFVNRVGGGPDGLIIDEHDNLWVACNQSNEVLVLEPTHGRVIAKLGDFGGVDRNGAPVGFLWSNSLVFHGDEVLVTNLALDVGQAFRSSVTSSAWRISWARICRPSTDSGPSREGLTVSKSRSGYQQGWTSRDRTPITMTGARARQPGDVRACDTSSAMPPSGVCSSARVSPSRHTCGPASG